MLVKQAWDVLDTMGREHLTHQRLTRESNWTRVHALVITASDSVGKADVWAPVLVNHGIAVPIAYRAAAVATHLTLAR